MSMMVSNLDLRKEDVSLILYIQDIYSGARYIRQPFVLFSKTGVYEDRNGEEKYSYCCTFDRFMR